MSALSSLPTAHRVHTSSHKSWNNYPPSPAVLDLQAPKEASLA